ncbi:MAG: DUF2071 domain-containing protein [Bacteroidia bacterium]|nr:DUF2071 domain-containing protein [Bacteroidia bacterium]
MKKVFLTAERRNLVFQTFVVAPEILIPYCPAGTVPAIWDGNAYLTLVAAEYSRTKVRGIRNPILFDFPEWNLRFYADCPQLNIRGFVYLKAIVPKHCIALWANKIYQEPYETLPMEAESNQLYYDGQLESIHIAYDCWKQRIRYRIRTMTTPEYLIDDFGYHYWDLQYGFGVKEQKTMVYWFEKEKWLFYRPQEIDIEINFGAVFGTKWQFLNIQKPIHQGVSPGGLVKIYSGIPLQDFLL